MGTATEKLARKEPSWKRIELFCGGAARTDETRKSSDTIREQVRGKGTEVPGGANRREGLESMVKGRREWEMSAKCDWKRNG